MIMMSRCVWTPSREKTADCNGGLGKTTGLGLYAVLMYVQRYMYVMSCNICTARTVMYALCSKGRLVKHFFLAVKSLAIGPF